MLIVDSENEVRALGKTLVQQGEAEVTLLAFFSAIISSISDFGVLEVTGFSSPYHSFTNSNMYILNGKSPL